MSPGDPSNRPRKRGEPARAVLAGGTAYFLVVFGVGFVLGIFRTIWLVPWLGVRWAELLEIPVMLGVIYWAARWVSRRFRLAEHRRPVRVGAGLVGLLLLVGAELVLALGLGGQSPGEYVASRDPVSGTVYALSLLLFAAMPALVARQSQGKERRAGLRPRR